MTKTLLNFLMFSSLLFSGGETFAATPDKLAIRDNLPRHYSGTFNWHGNKSVQYVSIAISKVYIDSENNIIAEGAGKYTENRRDTNIDIIIKISPETLRFEMWEKNPADSGSFVTDGSHVGTISNDLKTIKAVWTTKSNGKQGDWKLGAE